MAQKRLTKQFVDSLVSSGKDVVIWCAELSGFGVRVRPSVAKSFIAMYRVGGRNSPSKKVTIGSYPKLTVEQARNEAKAILAKAALGTDTAAEKAKKNAEMTIAQLCDLYILEGAGHKKASTLAIDSGHISAHIKPLIGKSALVKLKALILQK